MLTNREMDYIQARAEKERQRNAAFHREKIEKRFKNVRRWFGKRLAADVRLLLTDDVISFSYKGQVYYVVEYTDYGLLDKIVKVANDPTRNPFSRQQSFFTSDQLCAWLVEGGWGVKQQEQQDA